MKEFIQNYFITKDGRVFSNVKNKGLRERKTHINDKGYLVVTIRNKSYRVHRLVAENFVDGWFEDAVVNHIDGNKLNNNASNLEWCTQRKNVEHAWRVGLCTKDKNYKTSPVYKISMEDFSVVSEYPSIKDAEKDNPKARGHIASCCTGNRSNAGGYYWVYKDKYNKETIEDLIKIKRSMVGRNNPSSRKIKCITTGEIFDTMKEACIKYNLDNSNLSACCRGRLKTTGGKQWGYAD